MAAFDNRSEAEVVAATSITVAHTTAGSNRYLSAGITHDPGGLDVSTVTGTYNGVSMAVKTTNTTTANRGLRVFELVAPAVGSNNIVLSWSGNQNASMVAGSISDVNQGTPSGSVTSTDGAGGGTSSTVSGVSSAVNDLVVDYVVTGVGVTGLAAAGGQTEVNQITGSAGSVNSIGMSVKAGAASVQVDWSWTGFVAYMALAFNVANGAAEAASKPYFHKTHRPRAFAPGITR